MDFGAWIAKAKVDEDQNLIDKKQIIITIIMIIIRKMTLNATKNPYFNAFISFLFIKKLFGEINCIICFIGVIYVFI